MRGERGGWVKAIGLLVLGVVIGIAVPGQQSSTAKEQKRIDPPRIGYVNVAKALRNFKWANQEGAKISKQRTELEARVAQKRETLASLNMEHAEAKDTEKERLKAKIEAMDAEIKMIEEECQKALIEVSNQTLVQVCEQFKEVARELAEERGLDVVELFPGASLPEHEKSPQVAQLMLQTPALMPYYLRPELDLTQEVIDRLNKKYPAKDE